MKQEVDHQNFEIQKTLHKLVRKPGKNFGELFDSLKGLKGDVNVQVATVKLVIRESLRFKRQHLVNLLEEHIQNMLIMEDK